MVDCTGRLVVEAFYGSDQVVIDNIKGSQPEWWISSMIYSKDTPFWSGTLDIQPNGCPQSCMPNSVEHLLEVHKDMVKALLVLQVFLKEHSKIENLLSCAPSCSEACLFFFDDLLSLWLQSIQEDSQYDLTWMTDQADGTVVLA